MTSDVDENLDADDTEESEDHERDSVSYEINYYPADLTLKGYWDKFESKQLIIPPFQRQYVWDQVRASKLIESFLLGLPVPGVFLYKERESNKLKVIDGQQRIMTAIRFFTGLFEEKAFRLKNVNEKWDGKKYDELSETDRYQIDDSVLRAIIVQQLSPDDDSSIYHVFERLNTGGINLNPMEIRKCVYSGKMMEMLEELNGNSTWRLLIGRPKPDKRMRDVEWVLRVLAFHEHSKKYNKPMKGFLNRYLIEGNKLDSDKLAEKIQQTKSLFANTCQYILVELGEKPFQITNRFNYAVLDSVFCVCIEAMKKEIKGIKPKFEKLKADSDFLQSVQMNTSDQSVVDKRFAKAKDFILTD